MLKLHKINWLRIVLAWGLFSVFMIGVVYAQALSGAGPMPWRTVVLGPLVYGLIWLLLTPVVFWLAASFNLTAGPRGRLGALLVHASANVGLTVLFRVLYVMGLVLVGAPGIVFSWATVLASVNVWLSGYWMLLFVAYALDFYARYHRRNLDAAHLEMQLLQAQLQALKMQLQPHFLFNTRRALPGNGAIPLFGPPLPTS